MKRLVLHFQNSHSNKLLGAAFVAALLSGCVNVPTMPTMGKQEVSLPQWYVKAPSNNDIFLYGEGAGSSLDEAKQNALNNMAARLQVTIQSTVKSSTSTYSSSSKESSYSKSVNKDLQVDVEKIRFSEYSIDKSVQIDSKFYVLAKVNRIEFFDLKKKELTTQDQFIDSKVMMMNQLSKIEKIDLLNTLAPKLTEVKKLSVLLHILNNEFDHSIYIKKYDDLINMIEILKSQSTLSVISNNHKGYFKDVLVDLLNQNKFTIASNSDIVLKLENKVKYSVYNGWNIAKVSTTLNVISADKIVATKIFATTGRSSTSEESALESASIQFRKAIEKETLNNIIFTK